MRRQPYPAAPYDKDVGRAAAEAFDRKSGDDTSQEWLLPLGQSLVRYHLHPEAKFWSADYDQHGFLARRHVLADAIVPIGKEADKLDDPEFVGSDEAEIPYDMSPEDRVRVVKVIKQAKKIYGLRNLSAAAKVSHHRVNTIVRGSVVADRMLITVSDAARALERRAGDQQRRHAAALAKLRELIEAEGRNAVAIELNTDPSNLSKYLTGVRPLPARMIAKLENQPANANR